jgi:putative ABC transport system substrate-binding protein
LDNARAGEARALDNHVFSLAPQELEERGRLMGTRRKFLAFVASAMAAGIAPLAFAQPRERLRRIGILLSVAEDDVEGKLHLNAFERGLQDLGWIEGRNIQVTYRFAAGDSGRMRHYAAELAAMAPDLLIVQSNVALDALRQQNISLPTLFLNVSDPVGSGFVASLSRPGGNTTGFTNFEPATGSKWLQVLKDLAPNVTRVTVLLNPKIAANVELARSVEAMAPGLGVTTIRAAAYDGGEIDEVINTVGRERNAGMIVMPNPVNRVHQRRIIDIASRHRVPVIYPFTFMARNGELVAYGIDHTETFRSAASYVDRILKGANPGELPVQQPTRYELVINLRAAKALNLRPSPSLMARANQLIE